MDINKFTRTERREIEQYSDADLIKLLTPYFPKKEAPMKKFANCQYFEPGRKQCYAEPPTVALAGGAVLTAWPEVRESYFTGQYESTYQLVDS